MSQQQYTTLEMPVTKFIKKALKWFCIVFIIAFIIGYVEGEWHPFQNYVISNFF